jgi:high-affinity iron transporter
LLALISAAMLSDAVNMLTQADWLPARHYLWDSSSWLAEDSLMGQLLYALLGYEATPTALQLAAYICGLLLVLVLPSLYKKGVASDASN